VYHPTTRVLTVLELLQTYGQLSSGELARRLEVTPRSVRRYIMMLHDLGIPVESTRGRHGGYRLRPGYKLPPLMFTNNEAMVLTIGLINVQRLGIVTSEPAIEGALAKLTRVLPESVREHVQAVQESTFLDEAPNAEHFTSETLFAFSRAVQQHRRMWIRYTRDGEETTRAIDPYGLVLRDGLWYIVGWCHLRQDDRVFRLDRVQDNRVLSVRFSPPDGVNPREVVYQTLENRFDEPEVELLLKTTLDDARKWVSIISGSLVETPEGVVLTCNTGSLDWLATFIARMPWDVTIRKPRALIDTLQALSSRIAAISYAPAGNAKEGVTDRG
jgi:predicted DNA-binding transcriptional regulator YafY